jgi:hypothetical protein
MKTQSKKERKCGREGKGEGERERERKIKTQASQVIDR